MRIFEEHAITRQTKRNYTKIKIEGYLKRPMELIFEDDPPTFAIAGSRKPITGSCQTMQEDQKVMCKKPICLQHSIESCLCVFIW